MDPDRPADAPDRSAITSLPARRLAERIAAGAVSAVEALDAHLARVDRLNPEVNAIVTLDIDGARRRAEAADRAHARGGTWGPLHGVPMTVKDVWETAGVRTTCGAPELSDHVPSTNAVAVQRLLDAGAVVFGKTNTPLMAGDVQTYNDLFGVTNNPWDPGRTAGGSSGGSAAAVATGMTPLELGSDIGGSIRIPAHCCGVYGLKPTWGLVPTRGHIPGPPGTLGVTDVNCAGPLARSVDDLALAFEVIAGPDPHSAGWRLELEPPEARDGVEGLRVALTVTDDTFPVSRSVQSRLLAAADALAGAGAVVEEVPLPVGPSDMFGSWQDLVLPIIGAGLPPDLYDAFAANSGDIADDIAGDIAGRASRALVSSWRSWARADERRQHQRRAWARHFERWDVALCPVMPVPAFPHDTDRSIPARTYDLDGESRTYLELMAWCGMIGAMLMPVVALPCGLTDEGLPVGAQVIGADASDRALLATAAAMDAVIDGAVTLAP